MWRQNRVLVLWFVVFAQVLCGRCMKERFTATVGYEVRSLHQFQFQEGGRMELAVVSLWSKKVSTHTNWLNGAVNVMTTGRWNGDVADTSNKALSTEAVDEDSAAAIQSGIDSNLNSKTDQLTERRSLRFEAADIGAAQNWLKEDDSESATTTDLSNKLFLFHLTESQLSHVTSFSSMSSLCGSLESLSSEWSDYVSTTETDSKGTPVKLAVAYSFESNSEAPKWLTLLAVNCDGTDSYKAKFHIRSTNPGHEFLSASDVPNERIYLYLAFVWGIATLLWAINWQRYAAFNTRFHWLLTAYPLAMAVTCISWHLYWNFASKHGTESHYLVFANRCLDSFCDALLFAVLMLLTQGWSLIYLQLPSTFRRVELCGVCALFFLAEVGSYYYSSLVCVLLVCVVAATYRMARSLREVLWIIDSQIVVLEDSGHHSMRNDPNLPLNVKQGILQNTRRAFVLFLIAQIVYQWVDAYLNAPSYVDTWATHGIYLCFACFMGYSLRMRPFRVGFYVVDYAAVSEETAANQRTDDAPHPFEVVSEWPKLWRPGAYSPPPLPLNHDYSHWLSQSTGKTLLIENDIDIVADENSDIDESEDCDTAAAIGTEENETAVSFLTTYSLATPLASRSVASSKRKQLPDYDLIFGDDFGGVMNGIDNANDSFVISRTETQDTSSNIGGEHVDETQFDERSSLLQRSDESHVV